MSRMPPQRVHRAWTPEAHAISPREADGGVAGAGGQRPLDYGPRPSWPLITAANQVLMAGRWRRRAPTETRPDSSMLALPAAGHGPSTQWFIEPTANAGKPGALRAIGDR